MTIYDNTGKIILDIPVDDDSYRFRAVMQAKKVELHYSLPGHVELPVGAYVEFQGERYTLWYPEHFQKHATRNLEYKVTFGGNEEILKKYKYKLLSSKPYKLKFPLTAKPKVFIQLLVDNLNLYDSGWKTGTVMEATEKLLSFNHENCWAVLGRLAQEFDTEFEIVGKTIHFGKVEKFKDAPLALSYGKGNGFVPGLGRANQGDNLPVEILYVQGGDRNIDYSSYGSQTLLLPKSQELEYEGRTYKTDADGMYICRADKPLASHNEDSYDASQFYPSRVGTISKVDTEQGKDTDGKEVTFYNFYDASIPGDLDFKKYLIAGQTMTVVFQSGRLTGREFDANYVHEERKFEIVSSEQDGMKMPNESMYPETGDTYVVFNISLPAAYICDNASRTGASWDMFREAVRYLREHEEQQFTFSGELDGIWARKNWLAIGGKIQPGGYVDFSDTQFQQKGILIRITGVTDYINNPHSPKLELSNSPVSGFLSDTMGKLEGEEVKNEEKHKEALSLTRRRWRDAKEGLAMLEAAISGFGASINPITIQTMAMLVGDESLQYRFVNSRTNPTEIMPDFKYDQLSKVFTSPKGILQHMTLGVSKLSSSHAASEYKYWDMQAYVSPPLDDVSAMYLYSKCSKSGTTGTFLLSKTPYKMDPGDGYYYFLTGALSSEFENERSFVTVYGFTEILPGRITVGMIVSPDGQTYFNVAQGEFGGKFVFKSGTTGYENISDRPNLQPIYEGVNDALSDAENASNAANNALGVANTKAQVFYSTYTPSGGKLNDLWVDGVYIRRFNGTSWEIHSLYDAETRINKGLVTTGAVAVGPTGNPTGGISGTGTVRIWAGGGCNAAGTPINPTFSVESNGNVQSNGTITANNAIKLRDNMAGITGGGTAASSVRIWAGNSNIADAPFKVTQDGTAYMSKGVIGNFNLSNGWLTSNAGAYMSLSYEQTHIMMGPNLFPAVGVGLKEVMSVKNGQNNYGNYNIGDLYTNIALDLTAQGSDLNYLIKGRYFDTNEISLLFRRMPGDASWLYRGCIKVQRMPAENHINALGSGNKYKVGWDDKTGLFYVY